MASFSANGGRLDELGHTRMIADLFTDGYGPRLPDAWKASDPGDNDMTVEIGEGSGFILAATTYGYPAWIDDVESVTVDAADGSNPRKDIVVAYIDLTLIDNTVTNNPGALKFLAVAGTPGSSPNDPSDGTIQTAVGASNPFYKLARLTVDAGVTTIPNNKIDDLRTPISLIGESQVGQLGTVGTRASAVNFTSTETALTGLTTTVTVPDLVGRYIVVSLNIPNVKNDNSSTTTTDTIRIRRNSTSGTLYQACTITQQAQFRQPVFMETKPLLIGTDVTADTEYTFIATGEQGAGTGQILGSAFGTAWIGVRVI